MQIQLSNRDKTKLPFKAMETILNPKGEYLGSFSNIGDAAILLESIKGELLSEEIKFDTWTPFEKREIYANYKPTGWAAEWNYYVDASDNCMERLKPIAIFKDLLTAKMFAQDKSKVSVAHSVRGCYYGTAEAHYLNGKEVDSMTLVEYYERNS